MRKNILLSKIFRNLFTEPTNTNTMFAKAFSITKLFLIPIIGLLVISNTAHAQYINEGFDEPIWSTGTQTGATTSGSVVITATSASSTVTYYTSSSSTATSINTTPNSGTWLYSKGTVTTDSRLNKVHSASNSWKMGSGGGYLITPITPGAVATVTFWAAPSGNFTVGINTNTTAGQPTGPSSGTNAASSGFTFASETFPAGGVTSMTSFSFTGSFSGPCQIGFFNTSGSSIYLDDIVISAPLGTPPSITTDGAIATSHSTATVSGTITQGTQPVTISGVCWSTTSGTETATSGTNFTTNGPTAGTAIGTGSGGDISGLLANTTYYAEAYVTSIFGTVYGAEVSFITGNAIAPTVTTTTISSITSFGGNTGGNVTDDGGSPVIKRGVVWSTATNPTLSSSLGSTIDGSGTGSYTSSITGLAASTTYYVRAYAINSIDTSYGGDSSFMTAAPQAALFSNPSTLTFPSTAIGNTSVLADTLTGSTLDGSTVSVTAPSGFLVSTSQTSGFASSINIPYSNGAFTQTIYIQFAPTSFTSYSGTITLSGGGASGVYILSPTVSGNGKLPTPAVSSNAGNDFWLGFGYQKDMIVTPQKVFLNIYVAAGDSDANVTVEMPGMASSFNGGVPYQVFIPRNTVVTIPNTIFPNNTFLDSTGTYPKGIHVYSSDGHLISTWMHTYSYDNSAGGSLLFPTNTWNSSYYVLSAGGKVNNGYLGNSYFFVVAQEDSTPVTITLSNPIIKPTSAFTDNNTSSDTLYGAGTTFTVVLNKGQVFNGVGYIDGSTDITKAGLGALDLTGTKISTTCNKKIAVFAGDGRLDLTDVPGCFATSATSDHLVQQMLPSVAWGTKYLTTPTKTMEFNMFKIVVQDTSTNVTVNNNLLPHSSLINSLYYSIATDSLNLIESDKPISVAQYILGKGCSYLAVNGDNSNMADPEMIILSPIAQGIKKVNVYSATFESTQSEPSTGGSFINVILKKDGLSSFMIDGLSGTDQVDTGYNSNAGYPLVTDGSMFSSVDSAFNVHPMDTNYVWANFRVASASQHTISSNSPFTAIAYGTRGGKAGESYGYNAGTQLNDLTSPLIIQNPYGNPTSSANNTTLKTCLGTDFKIYATLPYQTNKITFGYQGNPHISPNADTTLLGIGGANIVPDSTFTLSGQTFYVYKLNRLHQFDAINDYQISITSTAPAIQNGACGGEGSDKTISYTISVVNGVNTDFNIGFNSCKNDTVQLTDQSDGKGFNVISWKWTYNNGANALASPLDTIPNPKFLNPADNTANNFTLRAVNSIGCYSDKTEALPVAQSVTPTFNSVTPTTICSGATPPLLPLSSDNGIPGTWNPATVSNTATKIYAFTPASGLCALPTTLTITVTIPDTPTFNSVTPRTICSGATPPLLPLSSDNDISGGWNQSTVSNTATATYTFTPTAGLCAVTDTLTITVIPSTTLSIKAVGPLCVNAAPVPLVPNVPGGTFSGDAGVTGSTFDPAAAGVGTHQVTYSTGGCNQPVTTQIVVGDIPVVTVSPVQPTPPGTTITLTGNSSISGTYLWTSNTSASITEPTALSTTSVLEQTTLYTLSVTTNANCTGSDTTTVALSLPCVHPERAFSPNGDGVNDKWFILDPGCATAIVNVYNRWGGLVFHSDNYTNNWDGKYKGVDTVPDGTYYYVIQATYGGRTYTLTGNVTIIR